MTARFLTNRNQLSAIGDSYSFPVNQGVFKGINSPFLLVRETTHLLCPSSEEVKIYWIPIYIGMVIKNMDSGS
jgi:hypothetical protein